MGRVHNKREDSLSWGAEQEGEALFYTGISVSIKIRGKGEKGGERGEGKGGREGGLGRKDEVCRQELAYRGKVMWAGTIKRKGGKSECAQSDYGNMLTILGEGFFIQHRTGVFYTILVISLEFQNSFKMK